jgi:hypothetical protein
MKKLIILPAIALALTGLLVFTACPTGSGGGGSGPNTSMLENEIQEAWNALYGIKIADTADDVATGLFWVTEDEMDTFRAAIKKAEEVKDNPPNQSSVNAAKTKLKKAITAFNDVKKDGTAWAIKLSGTITVKENGQTVPFVEIIAHNSDFSWQEAVRVPSSQEKAPWEIITKQLSKTETISFRVAGFTKDNYIGSSKLFSIDVKNLTTNIVNYNINDITIDLAALQTITLSGTINTKDGKPVPSIVIQAYTKEYSPTYLGEAATLMNAGNNTPWSMKIEALVTDTPITFYIVGFAGSGAWFDEQLFDFWGYEPDPAVTVKNQNISGINLTPRNFITLSGTITVTYDGDSVPYVKILAWEYDATTTDDNYWKHWLATKDKLPLSTPNTPWSMYMEELSKDTEVWFQVNGYDNLTDYDNDDPLFEWGFIWTDNEKTPYVKRTVKDQDVSGIVLNVGNIEPKEDSGDGDDDEDEIDP